MKVHWQRGLADRTLVVEYTKAETLVLLRAADIARRARDAVVVELGQLDAEQTEYDTTLAHVMYGVDDMLKESVVDEYAEPLMFTMARR